MGRGHIILKRCSDCGKEKPVGQFHRRKTSLDGYMSYCSECNVTRTCAWQKKMLGNSRVESRRLAWRQKHPRQSLNVSLSNSLKRRPTPNPITLNQLCDIWEKQGGLCAISGIRMTWCQGKVLSTSISVDRIDSEVGYAADNVRLVCHSVNAFRGQMSDDQMYDMALAIIKNMKRQRRKEAS